MNKPTTMKPHSSSTIRHSPSRAAFTLVELLVVIAIIGILVALLMPAVQAAREAARRVQCSNNLKQLGLACHTYQTSNGAFPPGHTDFGGNEHSWCTLILPFLEQQALYDKVDFTVKWNHANNRLVKEFNLAAQLCPSSDHKDPGQGDYGGINGPRGLPGLPGGWRYGESYAAGVLIATGGTRDGVWNSAPISAALIRDGLSNTLIIAEDAGRTDSARFWVNAHQTYVQHGLINKSRSNEIFSDHPGGAMAAFADGHVQFLKETLDMTVIDAIGTRDRGEQVDTSAL